jgi:polysaccharide transporter, PST family
MLNTLKTTWGRNRKVIGNFLSLSIVQFANYMAPLILIPYLTRVLGLSRFGLVELARAVSVYFLILTDYGFSLSATRKISVHRDDPKKVSEAFSSVILLKGMLVLLGAGILSTVVFALPRLRADWPVYYLSFASVFGMWLFPVWLFQGLERMKPIAAITVAAKLLVIVSTVLVVRNPEDYLYVPLLHSAGTIFIGLAGLTVALRIFPVRFHLPSVDVLKREFLDGWHLFLSRMATTLYRTSNIVILGLFTDHVYVAYYAAGEKIVWAAADGLLVPLSQAVFPHIGRLASQSRQAALRFAVRVAGLLIAATVAISAGLFFGAPYIARAALGQDSRDGAAVIRILSLLPVLIGLSNIFGVQIMVNFGMKRTLTRILIGAGALNLIVALSLVLPLRHIGVSVASLATELVIAVVLFLALRKRGWNVLGTVGGECCGV